MCVYWGVTGLGLGLCMQIFVLAVQNTFPNAQMRVATSRNSYFRQIRASLGGAIVGSVFTEWMIQLLTERMPAGAKAGIGSSSSLTRDTLGRGAHHRI